MKRLNKSVEVILAASVRKKKSIQQSVSVFQSLRLSQSAERKMIDYLMQWTFVFLAPKNEDQQSSIRPVPVTASRAWIYDYIALIYFICIPPIQQCGLECATPPRKNCSPENSSQAVPNPLNAINPAFTHSTSLSLYFTTFLHGKAWLIWLSRMGDRKVWGLGKVFGSIA